MNQPKKSGRLFVKMEVSNIIRVARDCLVLQRNSCGPGKARRSPLLQVNTAARISILWLKRMTLSMI